jgi:hypothetical protein
MQHGGLFSIVILYPSAEIARALAPCIPETKENWLVWLFDGWQKEANPKRCSLKMETAERTS